MMHNDLTNKIKKQADGLIATIQTAEKEALKAIDNLPEGKQKELLKLAMNKAKKGDLNPVEFAKQFKDA